MAFDLIRVCLVGPSDPTWLAQLQLPDMRSDEAAGLDVSVFADDADLERILVEVRPQVIVSIGREDQFPRLYDAPLEVRRRWIAVEDPAPRSNGRFVRYWRRPTRTGSRSPMTIRHASPGIASHRHRDSDWRCCGERGNEG
jgi:hypothetical protein